MAKSKKIFFLSIISIAIISLLGLSYAYIARKGILGNNTNNTVQINLVDYGQIVVTYDGDSDRIEATTRDLPKNSGGENYNYFLKFDIRNIGSVPQEVSINWHNVTNNFCQNTSSNYECTGVGNYVGNELNYALYTCTTQGYADVTYADDPDLNNCTKLTETPNPGIPTGNANIKNLTIPGNTTNYYVVLVSIKNIDGIQNYQFGASFTGSINVAYPTAFFGINPNYYPTTTALGYKILSDSSVTKYNTPATTSKGTALWIPTENEWKTLVCDSNSIWYSSYYCSYCDSNNANYNATTCSTNYNTAVTSKYVVGENGIFSVTNANGTSYYYRGGEGCSILGNDITSTYSTAATCIAANGNWMALNRNLFKCYANGTPQACTNAGGTWSYLNNNVSFAGFNWKIVRINEDGSIRIVLDGLTSTVKKEGSSDFAGLNSIYNSDYAPGMPNASLAPTAIDYISYGDSNLENAINSFYETYIDNSTTLNTINYSSYLADSTFCCDTTWSFQPQVGQWQFSLYARISNPTFECPSGSTYKVTNSSGITLAHPIATLSGDELLYAGGYHNNNSAYYMNNPLTISTGYWILAPYYWNNPVLMLAIDQYGDLSGGKYLNAELGVRPVLNLRSDVLVVGNGDGSADSPYQIGN